MTNKAAAPPVSFGTRNDFQRVGHVPVHTGCRARIDPWTRALLVVACIAAGCGNPLAPQSLKMQDDCRGNCVVVGPPRGGYPPGTPGGGGGGGDCDPVNCPPDNDDTAARPVTHAG